MPRLYRECVQCEHDFYISDKDQEFFASRNLELPKRCWACRKSNRSENAARVVEQERGSSPIVEVFVPTDSRRKP